MERNKRKTRIQIIAVAAFVVCLCTLAFVTVVTAGEEKDNQDPGTEALFYDLSTDHIRYQSNIPAPVVNITYPDNLGPGEKGWVTIEVLPGGELMWFTRESIISLVTDPLDTLRLEEGQYPHVEVLLDPRTDSWIDYCDYKDYLEIINSITWVSRADLIINPTFLGLTTKALMLVYENYYDIFNRNSYQGTPLSHRFKATNIYSSLVDVQSCQVMGIRATYPFNIEQNIDSDVNLHVHVSAGLEIPSLPRNIIQYGKEKSVTLIESEPQEENIPFAVLPGLYDKIEETLDGLNRKWNPVSEKQIADYATIKDYQAIFLNCGSYEMVKEAAASLEQFIYNGGALYASDFAIAFIMEAFPGYIELPENAYIGQVQYIDALITDDGLANYLSPGAPPSSIELFFNLAGWVAMEEVADEVTIHLQGDLQTSAGLKSNKPLLVSFQYGEGKVVFTSFHNHPQTDQLQQKLLEYLVLIPEASQIQSALEEFLKKLFPFISTGDPNINLLNKSEEHSYTYAAPGGKDLLFAVNWGGSELKLSVFDPDGNLYQDTQSNSPPINILVENASAGEWRYTVTAIDVPRDRYLYTALAGETKPVSFSVTPAELEMNLGEGKRLAAKVMEPDQDYTVKFISSDENVVTIETGHNNTSAVIKAKGEGIAMIEVTVEAGNYLCHTKTVPVHVLDEARVEKLILNAGVAQMEVCITKYGSALFEQSGNQLYDYLNALDYTAYIHAIRSGNKFIALSEYSTQYFKAVNDIAKAIYHSTALPEQEVADYEKLVGFDGEGNPILEPIALKTAP